MSSEGSDSASSITLSLVAQFDDINRLNAVLNDGYSEECFLAFVKQMEWVRNQWAAAEAEAVRLQSELDEALRSLAKWEGKFAHVRKLLDTEKRERNHVLKKINFWRWLDLLFNDNRTKLNDETLQKLAFLNGTAQEQHGKLNGVPELNSTGTLLSEMSYSRSEDDLDISLASARRSWVQRGAWATKDQPATKKRRSSGSSFTKLGTVEVQGGSLVAKATTTLTLEKAPIGHELKPPQNFQPISESSDEAPAPRRSKTPQRLSGKHIAEDIEIKPSAPPRTAEVHQLLIEAYNESALSERTCCEWFQKFKNGDFNLEDKDHSERPKIYEDAESEELFEEDLSQKQKKRAHL
ncbi:Mariner Mos1 transposase [Eumeta japonica]|uniref:Mariner Mos1 transposase n=1 Tax=Eumeta variegata TaxID=151549 RepID=A0A4C1ZD59_EUMVA|nr:Mariner Mos1 transposase [Eumeta japonica]